MTKVTQGEKVLLHIIAYSTLSKEDGAETQGRNLEAKTDAEAKGGVVLTGLLLMV